MKLEVYLDTDIEDHNFIFDDDSIAIFITPDENIEFIYNNNDRNQQIKNECIDLDMHYDDSILEKYEYKNLTEIEIFCLDNIELEKVLYVLENNNLEHFNKIIINITRNQYNELQKIISYDFPNNVFFKLEDNSKEISIKEVIKLFEKSNNINKGINLDELSPLEQLLYLYDIYRDKVYQDNEDDKMEARDLIKTMNGDYIVCLGFARNYDFAVKQLGFRSQIEFLFNKVTNRGHARNMIYVNDPKYNVDSIFYFDLTHDCKKSENDNTFLNSYWFFAKSLEQIRTRDRFYQSETTPLFNFENPEKVIKEMTDINASYGITKTINQINELRGIKKQHFTKYINIPTGIIKKDICIKDIREAYSYVNKKLDIKDFIRCFQTVREKQHQENPDKYPYSEDVIINTIYESIKSSDDEEFILNIFGLSNKEKVKNLVKELKPIKEKEIK